MIEEEGVIARPTFEPVDAEAAGQEVAASTARDAVVVAAAEQPVAASAAEDGVAATEADEIVGSGGAGDPIGAGEDVGEEAVVVAKREDVEDGEARAVHRRLEYEPGAEGHGDPQQIAYRSGRDGVEVA